MECPTNHLFHQKSILGFLKPIKTIFLNVTPTHSWIHALTRHERLIYHLNARYAFPNRTPIMTKGVAKGDAAHAALKVEKHKFIDSMKLPPTSMLIDCPDPHGTGGNTGKLLKKFNSILI